MTNLMFVYNGNSTGYSFIGVNDKNSVCALNMWPDYLVCFSLVVGLLFVPLPSYFTSERSKQKRSKKLDDIWRENMKKGRQRFKYT